MKLTEALTILKSPPAGDAFEVVLACGYTPLHLETFLAAHLSLALPQRRIAVRTGLFGDVAGTLEAVPRGAPPQAVAVVLEWADLDPRLGFRQLGGWGLEQEADYGPTARRSLERILSAVQRIEGCPVAVSPPSLPLPPAFHTAGWQAGATQWELEAALAEFARTLARLPSARIANRAGTGPSGHDLKAELLTGFPYRLERASQLGETLARLIQPPAPKKGLITDLDDTFWHGLVGETGPENVSWDLASHHSIHGLYQQLLRSLADSGVLLGVASKNDPAVVQEAFRRSDLVLPAERIFPVEAHWHAKSGSVAKILKTWNIAADAVVFIDDSPIELEEVAAAHPGITCLAFPKGSPEQVLDLLWQLRNLFGKHAVAAEDAYRLESIRRAAEFQESAQELGDAPEELLAGLQAEITVDLDGGTGDPRALELVNKTNQFNLNGARYTEADWRAALRQPGAFLAVISYQDKFGPLGKIAVVQGRALGPELWIDTWVMSCRAFARRVEHRCLAVLLEQLEAREAVLRFQPTAKNGPLRDFLASLLPAPPEAGLVRIGQAALQERLPPLYHSVLVRKPAGDRR